MMLDPPERDYLLEMRGLTTDVHGREVYAGLTVEESEEYFALTRPNGLEFQKGVTMAAYQARRERYRSLHNTYEIARLQTIGAESVLKTFNPTRN